MQLDTYEAISRFDPAIDWRAMPREVWQAYFDTRDVRLLDAHRIPGAKPTVYVLRECPADLWFDYVLTAQGQSQQELRAFLACVVTARDLRGADGVPMGPDFAISKHDNGIIKVESLKRFPIRDVMDIAEVAFYRSFFQDATGFTYPQRPSLLELWDAMRARPVDVNLNSPAPSNEPASAHSGLQL